MIQRFVGKTAMNDDYLVDDILDEEYDDEYEDYENADVYALDSASDDLTRIFTARPTSFESVREFAVPYRNGTPVILNLEDVPAEDQRRIVDFSSGLCFGLEGHLNRISDNVFLLTPHSLKMETASNT
ncbi:MAG: cell division protein SepF [Actinomycetaceae bacterium]|nr:cell division protein SepF [Actinomycetaceae bacterium]